MPNKMYAVKVSYPFGTYTMATTKTEKEAKDYINARKNPDKYFVEETDGVYNGSIKIK